MNQLHVPAEALVAVWCIGIAFGYFLAWVRFNRAYVLVDKEALKRNKVIEEHAKQDARNNRRCACCKETRRSKADTFFTCGCIWSAEDLIMERFGDHTCSMHRQQQRAKTGRSPS